ncbi:MAG TPA: RNA-binding S4 domain-containing protein [Candidatus Coprenecus stercoravium]|uniref:Pseudouridine synthase n=1 Tax=Candidatus Coprenecus stercoravium TaxID=2840735 RepID=A0A9D2GQI8_9BACT|nr:RNA-binding S4 domain-containing protein [Candidatus Coprenecus stercoravium]
MRPRIKRSFTRDGHDQDRQKSHRNKDSRPRREDNRRPEGKRAGEDRPDRRRSRAGQEDKPAYGNRRRPQEHGGSQGYGRAQGHGTRHERTERSRNGFKTDRRRPSAPRTAPAAPIIIKEDDGLVRLNKFIANSGVCSRREADEYISAGLVTVNGEVVTELGVKVKPGDDIRFNGERLRGEKKVYVLMNKPKDYVTTTSDPHAEKNVMQLISRTLCPERIFPVGRLDKSTTGVLLLTNDGELAERLTHPSYQKKKIYQVTLDKNVKQEDMDRLVKGVSLEDGVSYADEVAYNGDDRSIVGIEIHSGKNRIVRRMFEALGYKVRKLDRVYFAGLTKKNLRRGQWRFLSDEEVVMLKNNFYE